MQLPQDRLRMACLALQESLPEITPDRLQEALRIGYKPGTSKIELVTVNQAAKIMMVSPITIYRMVYAGKLTRYLKRSGLTGQVVYAL